MMLEGKSTSLSDDASKSRPLSTDQLVDALREEIVSLALQPGGTIDKRALCERFGVSRFPVSAALLRLRDEGLVEVKPQSGTRVSRLKFSDVRENMFIRQALEALAVRSLAGSLQASTLAEIERNLKAQAAAVAAGDLNGFHTLDLAFHEIMLDAVGFSRVKTFVETARLAIERVRRLLATPRRQAVTLIEHRAIVAGLRARDPARAVAALEAHLGEVMAGLLDLADRQPELFADLQDQTRQDKQSEDTPKRSRNSAARRKPNKKNGETR